LLLGAGDAVWSDRSLGCDSQLRRKLLEYCKRDTFATMRLVGELRTVGEAASS
jgi:hypothetical protein